MKTLPAVVRVDSEKCTNCHACIGACPVKYCNDASDTENGITVNDDLCIGCGACVKACQHQARILVDDTQRFMDDLKSGVKIATLVAPSVDVNFPHEMNNLLGWLKSIGVAANYDVSFGAEITTYQYLKALQNGAKTPIIAQPCPAVVSYIEIYKPNLIKHLAPTGSPVMDMACWVKHNHPDVKLAFISPCLGKKREFDDPNTKDRIQYNVTIANLKKYMAEHGVDLDAWPAMAFDGPMEAERAVLYSQPGGLFETFKRYNVPLRLHHVRRTEGQEIYEEFFEELEKEIERGDCDVLIVDILNCLHGCNRGTGTVYDERTTNEVLKLQSERVEKQRGDHYATEDDRSRLEEVLQNMEDIDFSRTYTDRSESYAELADPDEDMIQVLHVEMGKTKPSDIKNCRACGYDSCTNMAKAILNGLYRPQQCHHFLEHYYNQMLDVEEKAA